MDDTALLDLATKLAWQAAELILSIRARGFTTSHKSDRSAVTDADRAAEDLITAGLRAATPLIPVVAEEEIASGYVPRAGAMTWFVDPLDGTRDFAAGRDTFCVNIGLVRGVVPLLGAVCIPATAEIFGGIVGVGAFKQDAAGRRPIRTRAVPEAGLVVVANRRFEDDPQLRAFLTGRKVASVTHIGSAIKVCRVAEGVADLYVRFGRTMEWDTAAPQAILMAAGGRFTQLDGAALVYGKPGWANAGFLVQGQ
jgi:3'(2'), 5'-bisphosphate nucleotidase